MSESDHRYLLDRLHTQAVLAEEMRRRRYESIVECFEAGVRLADIARTLGVTRQYVYQLRSTWRMFEANPERSGGAAAQ